MDEHYGKNDLAVLAVVRDGFFSIDDEGRVWRTKRRDSHGGRWPCTPKRAESKDGTGYLQVETTVDGRRVACMAHRLVWVSLHGLIPAGLTINHKNGIRIDNRPDNLELATRVEQIAHMRNVLGTFRPPTPLPGALNPAAKLNAAQVAEIRRRHSAGEQQLALSVEFGMSNQQISRIVNHLRWQTVGQRGGI